MNRACETSLTVKKFWYSIYFIVLTWYQILKVVFWMPAKIAVLRVLMTS